MRKMLLALAALLCLQALPALAQSLQPIPVSYLSAATTNSTLISGAGQNVLKWLVAGNTTAVVYYLKVYDKATAPVCGTDIPILRIPVPPSTATNGGVTALSFDDTRFTRGIGFCLTAALADNDTGVAAVGVALNFGYLWQ